MSVVDLLFLDFDVNGRLSSDGRGHRKTLHYARCRTDCPAGEEPDCLHILSMDRKEMSYVGQGENPVFRITKKPPSETGVKKPRYLSPFFYVFEFS